ncbi:hypothetical protein CU048_06960 [Beijerinckiaceae bacterium]|nr:hypothetical protein CU048_06960 [Beijerinckiaceae bacterium]
MMPEPLIEAGTNAMFIVSKRFTKCNVPDEPHFDDRSTQYFMEKINNSAFYVEYGTGGSTVQAAKWGKPFVAVDSDKVFMNSVRAKIGNLKHDQHLVHVNIGITGLWGIPLFKTPKPNRVRKWMSYPQAPWRLIGDTRLPDLILVDGRFRVACALTSIKYMSKEPSNALLLVDDYADRPHYRIIERFAQLERMVGRMAVFSFVPAAGPELEAELERHYSDWR